MLQLAWKDERGVARSFTALKFPIVIGRSVEADLRFEVAGVWDSHAAIRYDSTARKFGIASIGESVLLVNGQRLVETLLRPGDRLQLGGAELTVLFPPAEPASLGPREWAFWIVFFLVLLFELFLFGRSA
jgi:pSer/pThr/pTyr-binding forkhead associated (FHA) protein